MNTKIIIILLLLAFILSHVALARSDDSEKPIQIMADTAELNDKTGVSVYRGDVEMIQGTTILTGDTVTVYTVDNEVNKIVSVGELATYQETTDDGDIVFAEAEEMIYYRDEKKVELFRKAKITQLDNVIRSEYILYLTEEGFIDTGTNTDRVNIVIQPESKPSKEDNKEENKENNDASQQ
ncbi:MAG: lipopolysaccharide transport periplasmic protein LptA [Pseudomonadota bacterium]